MKIFQDIAKKLDPDVPHSYLEKYYEEHYLKSLTMLGVMLFCSLIILISSGLTWYKGTHLRERKVIIVKPDFTLKQIPVYYRPMTNPNAIKNWAAKALRDMYTLDLTNYDDQIKYSRRYFTAPAADLYEKNMRSGIIANMLKNKLIVSAMVVDKPIITQTGSTPTLTAWKVEAVISILYEGAIKEPINNKYKVFMTIITIPTTDNYRGIGISQINLNSNLSKK